jgi:hypothetical protein
MGVLLSALLVAAPYNTNGNYSSARGMSVVFGANVLIGCLIGGVGSRLNDGGFFEGCGVGSLGGGLMFDSKLLLAGSSKFLVLAGVGKLMADVGSSMIANASANRNTFSMVSFTFGPIEYDVVSRAYRVSVLPIAGMLYFSTRGTLDWKASLYSLTPVYNMLYTERAKTGMYLSGATIANVVAYQRGYREALSHELVHTAQWAEWKFANEVYSWHNTTLAQDLLFMVSSAYVLDKHWYWNSIQEREAYYLQL